MLLSQPVIDDLAAAWIRLHRVAAPPHLEHMIAQMRRSGDTDGASNYARLLTAVLAIQRVEPSGVSALSMSDVDGRQQHNHENLSALSAWG